MLCFIKVSERGRGACPSYSIAVVDTRVDGCSRVVILIVTEQRMRLYCVQCIVL